MSRTSALGWVARTVLIIGSRTGLIPPPRFAPSRARRRAARPDPAPRPVPAPRLLAGLRPFDEREPGRARAGSAGSLAAGSLAAVSLPSGSVLAGSVLAGSVTGDDVASPSAVPAPGSTGSSGRAGVTSAPAPPVVATSPATGTPHVRQEPHSIGGRSGKCRAQRLVTQPAVSGGEHRAAGPARRGSSVP